MGGYVPVDDFRFEKGLLGRCYIEAVRALPALDS
jgi:hypothetical protein